jgi:hypothetical protein
MELVAGAPLRQMTRVRLTICPPRGAAKRVQLIVVRLQSSAELGAKPPIQPFADALTAES